MRRVSRLAFPLLNRGTRPVGMALLHPVSTSAAMTRPVELIGNRSFYSTSGESDMKAKKPFEKILIANRGEIACRVIKTARRLGIKTVAVYSDADRNSKHVQLADEAVYVGPPPSKDSYLVMDRILKACIDTGAQAVHPGYGFLSENCHFAELLEKNNIVFIGPPSSAIDAMGDKIHSKKLAKKAGVNVIPGFLGEVDTKEQLLEIAHEIGYPIMVKASAGGGGKGMRVAWNDEEAWEGYQASKEEAAASFGDDRILIEKYIDQGRHIEIQVMADGQGNAVYFFERECSIQRRNQKVIEEAPSPFLDEKTRKQMGEQAVALAKAVGYRTAGTVEFLVDSQRNFYFLEMNTRLQVEHPITEYITGHDLVEHMLRVASGEPLSVKQEDLKINGWAIESRVYAEDPYRNFLPSIGKLNTYIEPTSTDQTVRCDTGILEGSEISVYYDPLICKLVTWGPNRETARHNMRRALDAYVIRGVGHNVPFLRSVMDHPRYIEGRTTTKFIPEEYPEGFKGYPLTSDQETQLVAGTAAMYFERQLRNRSVSDQLSLSEEDPRADSLDLVVRRGDSRHHVRVDMADDDYDTLVVSVDGKPVRVSHEWPTDSPLFEAHIDGEPITMQLVHTSSTATSVQFCGSVYDLTTVPAHVEAALDLMPVHAAPDLSKMLVSPMPGLLVKLNVQKGDKVVIGQPLVTISAMKMLNQLRSTVDGVVKSVQVKLNDEVAADQILVEFE